ncbi:uncharacterized protein LOC130991882 isoform X3 [Salvia miltiorrhiza]|uniref:uncharacterized protein LOC130991882 isoform X3 n=1 Tax=Salvia miltiorrhiza TaxID=226208 RepID=UPI0025AB6139|nr:uncharacterized protein LOC130991882 isoform X3 [Salvia miltiorrhiza]
MFHAPFLSAQFVHLIGALEKVSALFRFPSSQSVMSESGGEESGKQGKRKAKADDSGGEELQLAAEDPLLVFGSEIMTIILSKLDVRSLAEARLVSRGWQAVASSDRIWAPKCQELWLDKAHIPRVSMAEGLPKIVATLLSIRDGKRVSLTSSSPYLSRRAKRTWEELCALIISYRRNHGSEFECMNYVITQTNLKVMPVILSNWQFANVRLESLGMTFVTMFGNSALQRSKWSCQSVLRPND